jgi:hypothetical protein
MPRNYRDCLDARQKYSPKAVVFLLVHKMDLVTEDRVAFPERCMRRLQRRATRCPSRYSTQALASTTKCCTRYTVRRLCLAHVFSSSSVSQSFPSPLPLCVDGLTRAGLVERRVWDHRERGGLVEAPDDIRQACGLAEAILIEGATFIITTSSPPDGVEKANDLSLTHYWRTNEPIGALKHSCTRMSVAFHLF